MAIVQTYFGYAVYATLTDRNELLAIVASGWTGIIAAAASAGLQLGVSPGFTGEFLAVVPITTGGQFILGIGEGVLTLAGVRLLDRAGVESEQLQPEGIRA
jgi:cobalt/nickel transport system permease protein